MTGPRGRPLGPVICGVKLHALKRAGLAGHLPAKGITIVTIVGARPPFIKAAAERLHCYFSFGRSL